MSSTSKPQHVPPRDWSELYMGEDDEQQLGAEDRGPRKFTLKLKVLKGTNLPIMDMIGTSDPYVIITLGDQKKKTKVIMENLNPEWNEEFSLAVTDLSQRIRFDVYDWDRWSSDDLIDTVELDIGMYAQAVQFLQHNCVMNEGGPASWSGGSVVQDVTLDLKNAKSGKIYLQLRWDHE